MDISKLKSRLAEIISKYKIVLLFLCLGLVLIMIPTSNKNEKLEKSKDVIHEQTAISQDALASILAKIDGAGRVEVLLSVEYSAQTDYQVDSDGSGVSSDRLNTVTVSDANRNESGLIKKTCAPIYRGAIVVCEGADDPSVSYCVVNAVSNITGLRSNQISVLKMK